MPLTAIERPEDVRKRWGDYRIQPTDSMGHMYEDELISLVVVPEAGTFVLEISNRSEHTLQIPWDQAAYVDADGYTSRVAKGQTRVIDAQRSQTPTVIPRNARALVTAVPTAHLDEGGYQTEIRDFVQPSTGPQAWEGKEVRLVLPLRVRHVVNEYTLIFELRNVELPGRSGETAAPVGIPGAPYTIPEGARFVGRNRGGIVYRLREGCTAWFSIPEDQVQFFWSLEYARDAGYQLTDEDVCR